MRLLSPNSRIKSVTTLLGMKREGSVAASRALERDYRSALADGTKNKRALVQDRDGKQSPPILPQSVTAAARAAREARKQSVNATPNAFTHPLSWGDEENSGSLKGLVHVSLPGFQVPDQILPNRLADPDGLLRPREDDALEEEPTGTCPTTFCSIDHIRPYSQAHRCSCSISVSAQLPTCAVLRAFDCALVFSENHFVSAFDDSVYRVPCIDTDMSVV